MFELLFFETFERSLLAKPLAKPSLRDLREPYFWNYSEVSLYKVGLLFHHCQKNMRFPSYNMTSSIFKLPVLMYMLKCVCGFSVCYALYVCFPQHQFYWSMISVLLVISPEEDSSHRLAFNRMKANILGSTVGIVIFLVRPPILFGMCLGIVITIALDISLKLTNATRSALASLVIVLMHEQQESSWNIALERMLCVVAGCIIAIIVTYIVGFISRRLGDTA